MMIIDHFVAPDHFAISIDLIRSGPLPPCSCPSSSWPTLTPALCSFCANRSDPRQCSASGAPTTTKFVGVFFENQPPLENLFFWSKMRKVARFQQFSGPLGQFGSQNWPNPHCTWFSKNISLVFRMRPMKKLG